MLKLNTEQLAYAKKLFELLLWQYPEDAELGFETLQEYLDEGYAYGINNAFRMSMSCCNGGFYTFDWNEYDLLFVDYLICQAKCLKIPLPNNLYEVEEISNSEAKDLYLDVIKSFAEYDFDVWWLDSDMNCMCIVPKKIREEIYEAASKMKLGLFLPYCK